MTGEKTVMRIYAKKVIDAYLDNYGLSYGREPGKEEWAEKMRRYTAVEVQPEAKFCDYGRHAFPMQVRLHAWRGAKWQAHLQELNKCMVSIMEAAKADPEIMPVARYVQDRRALNLCFAGRPEEANVVRYKKLRGERVKVL